MEMLVSQLRQDSPVMGIIIWPAARRAAHSLLRLAALGSPEPKSASWRPLHGGIPLSSVVVKPLSGSFAKLTAFWLVNSLEPLVGLLPL